jgi:hypothetical protein
MRFIVATLIGTPPLLAAKGLSASHLRCVKAAKRPKGLALTRTDETRLFMRCKATRSACNA